jgi:hypothetical protein
MKLCLALLFLTASLSAAENDLGGSGNAAAWLNLQASPLEASYGEALGSMDNSPVAGRIDPSALAKLQGLDVGLAHHQYDDGLTVESVAAGLALGGDGGLGLSARYVNLGSVDTVSVLPDGSLSQGSTINPYGLAVEGQYGLRLYKGLRAGLGISWVDEELVVANSSALQFSGGLGAALPWNLDASLSVTGLGSGLYGSSASSTVHASLAWLGTKGLPLKLGAGLASPSGDSLRYSAAMDYTVLDALALRAGWQQQPYGTSGPVLGLGYHFASISVDYAFQMGTALGSTHLIGLNYAWTPKAL